MAEIRSNYASDSLFVKTADVISFDNNVRIISQTEKNNSIETVLKKMNGKSNNEILQEIITQTSVISFEELLPTMNDIFIRTVKGEA